MALTVNEFIGFETGGLEESSSIAGTPVVQSTVKRSRTFALELNAATDTYIVSPFSEVADAGNKEIWGGGVRFSVLNVLTNFWQAADGGGFNITLQLKANGDLALLNDLEVEVGTATNPFTVDTFHFIEVVWDHANPGKADVFVDDVSVISVTGQNFTSGGTLAAWHFKCSDGITIHFDDMYWLSGATSVSDRLGSLAAVLGAYQNTAEDALDLGDALETGTWANVSQTPANDANTASYTSNVKTGGTQTDEGTRAGPSGDADVDGTIKAAKWIHRLKRGGGGGTTHWKRLGNSGDGMIDITMGVSPNFKEFFHISELATQVPTTSEFFQQGFRVDGPRDIIGGDIWAMLLHVSPAAPAVNLEELGAHQII